MKAILGERVPIAWFLLVCIATAGVGVAWIVATRNSPPANAVLISVASTQTPNAGAQSLDTGPSPLTGFADRNAAPGSTPAISPAVPTASTVNMLAVFVSGAVARPGVYTLPIGSRIADAVAAAGGLTAQANMEVVNLAQRIEDEQHITVPMLGAATQPISSPPAKSSQPTTTVQPTSSRPTGKSGTSTPQAPANGKLNINTATEAQFETLPSIGPVLAQRIVQDRETNGPFAEINDLMRVPGIKDALMQKIRPFVTTGSQTRQ